MGKNSGIEWTDHTLNFYWGCVEVSPGCDHCYAKALAKRYGHDVWGVNAPRQIIKSAPANALKWQREAEREGVVRRVFCQSMSDIGEILPAGHPQSIDIGLLRERLFTEIIPATPNLEWLLLTKRIGNMEKLVPGVWLKNGFPANVRVGISIVNQAEARRDIPKLLRLPCKNFLSMEPLLGAVNLTYSAIIPATGDHPDLIGYGVGADDGVSTLYPSRQEALKKSIDWVIVGGEAGHGARPMHPDWVRSLREQCNEAEVPFFFKQWGEWLPHSQILSHQIGLKYRCTGCLDIEGNYYKGASSHEYFVNLPEVRGGSAQIFRVGKLAGRFLDGREWSEFPNV